MSEHKYTLALVKDKKLRAALLEGDEGTVSKAVGAATARYSLTTEVAIPLDLLDGVSRVTWTEEVNGGDTSYRMASPDDCETGATRLADLLDEPRKLARGLSRLLEEESELEHDDDDIAILTDFLSENDAAAVADPDSTAECLGLYVIQMAAALQDAADQDAWLLAVLEEP